MPDLKPHHQILGVYETPGGFRVMNNRLGFLEPRLYATLSAAAARLDEIEDSRNFDRAVRAELDQALDALEAELRSEIAAYDSVLKGGTARA